MVSDSNSIVAVILVIVVVIIIIIIVVLVIAVEKLIISKICSLSKPYNYYLYDLTFSNCAVSCCVF